MKTQELRIEGMSCNHCVMAIRQELERLPAVVVKDVAIGRAVVQYDEREVSELDLSRAISDAGYRLVS
jgi:copper chaperone